MLFGVKNWLALIRIFFLSILCFIVEQQLVAQVKERVGVRKDAANLTERIDTLSEESKDSVEVYELSYIEKYKGIRFTKSLEHFNYRNVDTLFDLEHQFDPANKQKFRYNNIGIIGSPVYDMLPEFTSRLNFDSGFNQFKPYLTNADSIEVYKVNAPYTKLSWRFGSKMQQFFKVLHANRIKDVVQFGLSINRISGEGFYANQRVSDNGFNAYATYDNKNKRYKLITTLTTHKYVQEQNGGINEAYVGRIFEKVLNDNGQLVPVTQPRSRDIVNTNLQNTFSRNGGFNFAINQYLNFGKYFNETATDSTFVKRFVPKLRLRHKIAFVRNDNIYEGGSTAFQFYPDTLLYDQGVYLDTIRVNKIVNQLSLIQTGKSTNSQSTINLPFKSVLSLNYERVNVKRLFPDSLKINNIWMAFKLNDNLEDEALSYTIEAQYGLGKNNYQANKYFANAALGYQLPEPFGKVGASYTINNYNMAFLYQNYDSNFYKWENNFDATNINTASINYTDSKYNLSVSASRVNFKNLPYFFYEDVTDIQALNLANGNLYRFQLHKTFTFGWWKMKHQLTYQTENSVGISLPNWLYSGSFYYSDNWFKRALSFNAGFDIRYLSDFNLPYYNPVIGQFYNNQNNFIYPLYPTIDFFINCKIKTAILFFKVEYLNQNWFQRGYYTAVNYPAPDYTFRGGVSWRFFD